MGSLISTLSAVLLSCITIPILTSTVIDPYLHSTDLGTIYFDFYENNKANNDIFFIGPSYIIHGINASEIDTLLNYSYTSYNLGYDADTPNTRIIELDKIIESKPKIVVLGVSYFSFFRDRITGISYLQTRFGFVANRIHLDSYSRTLFNETELALIQPDYLHLLAYKRQLLIPALSNRTIQHINFKEFDAIHEVSNKTKEQFRFDDEDPYYCSQADNNNKRAFRYMVEEMKDSGIYVIIINMPLNPNYSAWFSNETRKNFLDVVSSVGCPYYDLVALCSPTEFADMGHLNYLGEQNMTKKMAKIIAKESRNVPA